MSFLKIDSIHVQYEKGKALQLFPCQLHGFFLTLWNPGTKFLLSLPWLVKQSPEMLLICLAITVCQPTLAQQFYCL